MKVLVIGASTNPERYSFKAINMLREYDHSVVAYGLREGVVADVVIDTTKKAYSDIDTITMYVNAKRQVEFYDYILSLKPKRVIFNPGTENPEFYALLSAEQITYEESCTLVLLRTDQF
ncbi:MULTISPECIES: CoA-binding protein [Myroides]|uniref:CoA-binding protein n=1 Tax=Myroides albus TaxID=2562892 RepID=A0A6I3LML5_9FLAO|nr:MULTISPECIES: CoA-binding protein [Myroides]MTG98957.1 CoA-binding protein [Myroides albus]MVX34353.1 CoA-binding protein [Myroides sp. LoEW2-1]UVD78575.1 CoA-binding protein [Myroides albus]